MVDQNEFEWNTRLRKDETESDAVRAVRHERACGRDTVNGIEWITVRRPRRKHRDPRSPRYGRTLRSGRCVHVVVVVLARHPVAEISLARQTSFPVAIRRIKHPCPGHHRVELSSTVAHVRRVVCKHLTRHHHSRRAVHGVTFVALLPARSSHPALQVLQRRWRANLFE